MTFRVSGILDGATYDVQVGAGAGEPVTGSRLVSRLVEQYTGRDVLAGPTGPLVRVSPKDPGSLLALLTAKTQVTGVTGDTPPAPGGAAPDGAVL